MCTHSLRAEMSSSSCPLAAASLEWRRHQSLDVDRAWANWDSLNKIHILSWLFKLCHTCNTFIYFGTFCWHIWQKEVRSCKTRLKVKWNKPKKQETVTVILFLFLLYVTAASATLVFPFGNKSSTCLSIYLATVFSVLTQQSCAFKVKIGLLASEFGVCVFHWNNAIEPIHWLNFLRTWFA